MEVDEGALKHGCTEEEVRWAVYHYYGREETEKWKEEKTIFFVGPRHEGDLPQNYIEVGVGERVKSHVLHAFHAITVTDNWRHLAPQI